MPSARGSESNKSFIIAIVIFIALFLASAVTAIVLFRERGTHIQEREEAVQDLKRIAGKAEISLLKPLMDPSSKTPVVAELVTEMKFMSEIILGHGQASSDLISLWEEVADRHRSIGEALDAMVLERKISPEAGLADVVQQLIQLVENKQDEVFERENENLQWEQQYTEGMAARDAQIAELQKQLDAEQRKAQTHEAEYLALRDELQSRYDAMEKDQQQLIADQERQLKEFQDENRRIDEEIKKYQVVVKQLNDRLRKFQRPPLEMTPLEPDGYIVNISEREDLAYINLAKGDQIYRGLRFTVYDRFQGIPQSGKGKGAIEVIEIMDSISKCRITHFDRSNPIMNHDIIANLVWNKDKQYNFCVAGVFDFDNDGKLDPDGLQRITELITHWGGRVTSTLSVDTDFLVLGRTPSVPTKPSDEYGMDSPVAQAYKEASEKLKTYEDTLENGKALDVPTFNLNRFLYFIGYFEPAQIDYY